MRYCAPEVGLSYLWILVISCSASIHYPEPTHVKHPASPTIMSSSIVQLCSVADQPFLGATSTPLIHLSSRVIQRSMKRTAFVIFITLTMRRVEHNFSSNTAPFSIAQMKASDKIARNAVRNSSNRDRAWSC
ncbi:hypothetical protein LOAG_02138 [Loa loa]|uniref:Secreted protein n=1 Tax=Loa loa TaxID=7209 RepID=A0A1S0U7L0_LOALO|nr:hypothetical protein LOAG_02138 [Loa loa]EFO26340.1 hypothetical protein LOAG_02138 [Loa loa]